MRIGKRWCLQFKYYKSRLLMKNVEENYSKYDGNKGLKVRKRKGADKYGASGGVSGFWKR